MRARYAAVALFVFNTLLVIAALEIGARALTGWAAPRMVDAFIVDTAQLPYYRNQPWREAYWRESIAVERAYHPYVGWREAPFAGETLQIDTSGIRRTPGAACEAGAYRILAFGGSTMWGVGAPDWETIPAHLQRLIAERTTTPVCVVNFASIGWVSTQSVIALLLELQRGGKPDLVLFYDGVNDVYAAYQNGRAGEHQNLESMRARIDPGLHSPLRELWEGSALVSLAREAWPPPPLRSYRTLGVDTDQLAGELLSVYLTNVDAVTRLALAHGFRAVFVWQPFLAVGAKPLAANEQAYLASLDPDLVALYRSTYEKARARSTTAGFVYLAGALDEIRRPLWIDGLGHLNPPGNELMARAIVDLVAARETADAPARRLFLP